MTSSTSHASRSARRPPRKVRSESLARFRRESWWQVTFPVIAASVLALAAVILVIVLGGPQAASVVADYSLMLVILANLILGLVLLAVLAVLIYLTTALLRATPPYTNAAQQLMDRVYRWVDRQTERIARLVIVIRSTLVGINTYLRSRGIVPGGEGTGSSKER